MTTCRKPAHRAYYVRYPRDFANEYSLRYTVSGAELSAEDGWEPSRSGYADADIYPAD